MQKKVFQLLANNTSGVLSRITGLFSRRGYNIESITAGPNGDSAFSRITIVTSGDDDVLEQIETVWSKMLSAGAQTFWETEAGSGDFDRSGSLCHGWSAVPLYIFAKYQL